MFTEPVLFGAEWARALRTAAETIELTPVDSTVSGERPGTLGQVGEWSYSYHTPIGRGGVRSRLGVVARRSALLSAFDELQRRHGAIDVAVAHFFMRARVLDHLRRGRGVRAAVIEHSSSLRGVNPDQIPLDVARRRAAKAYAGVDAVVFVSEDLRKAAAALGCVPRAVSTAVVHNPVDTALFVPPPEAPTSGVLRVVCVARLATVKRQGHLIDAVRLLVDRGVPVELRLAGDGPTRPDLEEQVQRVRLQEHVRLLGRLDRPAVAEELQQASVLALVSITENAPFAISEAMCTGLPVVATGVGGVPELLAGYPSVVLPVEHPAGTLAEALVGAAGSAGDRRSAASVGCQRFSYAEVGRQLADALERVSGGTA